MKQNTPAVKPAYRELTDREMAGVGGGDDVAMIMINPVDVICNLWDWASNQVEQAVEAGSNAYDAIKVEQQTEQDLNDTLQRIDDANQQDQQQQSPAPDGTVYLV
jgi:hypothetical protein